MTAVATWGGDSMPAGVQILRAAESGYYAVGERAEQIDARLRRHVGQLAEAAATVVDDLHDAWAANVHVHLGFDTFHAYVTDVFGDLHSLRLNGTPRAIQMRRAIVRSLLDEPRPDGKTRSVTDLERATGYSRGLMQSDRRAVLGLDDDGDKVTPIREPEPTPPDGPVWVQALYWLAREDDRGLTRLELAAVAGWSEGKAGGVLFRLRRKRLAVNPEGAARRDYEVFVVTEAGRAALDER